MEDLVASYTLTPNDGVTKHDLDAEIKDVMDIVKGIRRFTTLDLPGGDVAFEIHMHGQTDRDLARATAERVFKIVSRFGLAEVEFHGVEFPEDVKFAAEKWVGREALDEVTIEHGGQRFIRFDYYMHALSFADLGISDEQLEPWLVQAFQKWPNAGQAKLAIRRLRTHFERLEEARKLTGQNGAPKRAAASARRG